MTISLDSAPNLGVLARGPLLSDLYRRAANGPSQTPLSLLHRMLLEHEPDWLTNTLEQAGLRGRGGGGFPVGHKWRLVQRKDQPTKYFVCNATSADRVAAKEELLLTIAPERLIEAILCGSYASGATEAFLVISAKHRHLLGPLDIALKSLEERFALNGTWFSSTFCCKIHIAVSDAGLIGGEETALLNGLEGRPAQPRGKPPVPTATGLYGLPTAVSSLETVFQAAHILEVGPEEFRSLGTPHSPGSFLYTLIGDVRNPGIYELPLGITARELVEHWGGGVWSGSGCELVFPGGLTEPFLSSMELDTPLEYDALFKLECTLGTGTIVAYGKGLDPVALSQQLSEQYQAISCGKCRPCKDGTQRIAGMLHHLQDLNQRSADLRSIGKGNIPSSSPFPILGEMQALSYTDTKKGLSKITHLAEFVKYRGDCEFPIGAMRTIQKLLAEYEDLFKLWVNHDDVVLTEGN